MKADERMERKVENTVEKTAHGGRGAARRGAGEAAHCGESEAECRDGRGAAPRMPRGVRNAMALALLLACAGIMTACRRYEHIRVITAAQSDLPVQDVRNTDYGRGPGAVEQAAAQNAAPPVFGNVDETVYATGDSVNVRSSWSTLSGIEGQLKRGEAVRRTGVSSEWSRVIYKDKQCYIAARYLSAERPGTEASSRAEDSSLTGASNQAAVSSKEADPSRAGEAEGQARLDPSWKYAEFSKINSGAASLYKASGSNRKGITVCVNAGHGTSGGTSVKTLCHPDGTPKVTGGTTSAGATEAAAVSSGMTFADGTAEARVSLALAKKLKERLLDAGYDVLMIRESDDVQLDNVARTVIANNMADCHVALHWDSTSSDKGAFYMSVPGDSSYRNMEPVKSHWQQHNALGESLIGGLKGAGVKIFSGGSMEMDLTQTSYSTVPSVDIELGDKVSDHSDDALKTLAAGLLAGINAYFGQ